MREDLIGSRSSAVITSPLGSAPCSLIYCSMSRFSYTTPSKTQLAAVSHRMRIAIPHLLTRLLGRDRLLWSFSGDWTSGLAKVQRTSKQAKMGGEREMSPLKRQQCTTYFRKAWRLRLNLL